MTVLLVVVCMAKCIIIITVDFENIISTVVSLSLLAEVVDLDLAIHFHITSKVINLLETGR
jgi:hypothetical protein